MIFVFSNKVHSRLRADSAFHGKHSIKNNIYIYNMHVLFKTSFDDIHFVYVLFFHIHPYNAVRALVVSNHHESPCMMQNGALTR